MTNFAHRLNEIATSVTSERSDYKYFSYKTGSFDEVTGCAPVYLIVSGNKYSLDGKWFNLPVAACNAIEAINPGKVREVLESNVVKGLTLNQSGIRRPMFIKSSGIWMEKNCPARAFVRCTRTLFHVCGIDLAEADIVFVEKNQDAVFPGKKHVNVVHKETLTHEDLVYIPIIEKDMRENYSSGFDFSESSKRLVEERTKCLFSSLISRELQTRMFERKDGLWFFEDQIGGEVLRNEIVAQCKQWLDANPIVNLTQFVDLVGSRACNLEDDFDKGKYAEYVILQSDLGGLCEFNGKRRGRICCRREAGVDASKKEFAKKVNAILQNRFDAVPISELADLFPMVNEDWMAGNLPELLPDAILEDLGNRAFALKLLEFYYLPDDFSEAFNSITNELESDGEILSVPRILSSLDDYYGYDFKSSFALSESAFKQIATKVDSEHRNWTGAILGASADGGKGRLKFQQMVEKQFPRVFTHEEFYQFGANTWGWSEDHRAWHHKQLWNSFIRYDEDHWSSVEYFKKATNWSVNLEEEIGDTLRSLLGTSPFFSLSKVPQQCLDNLPVLKAEGRPICWTYELLASIAYFCMPRVRILNHAAAPHAVTSLLVPPDVPADTDGVSYMIQVFKCRNPHAHDGNFGDEACQRQAMEFLLENDVRQNSSQKLQSEVAELLRRNVL